MQNAEKIKTGKESNDSKKSRKEASFAPLFQIYKTVPIPWIMILLVVLISFGSQYVSIEMAKYSAKIDTGTMTGGSFLVGYVIFTVLSVVLENGYDLANGLGHSQMSRNVRKKLWGKMLRLPVSTYEKEEPQRLVSRITKDSDFAYGAITAVIQIVSIVYGVTIAMVEIVGIFGVYSWIMAAVVPVLFVCSIVVGKIQYRIERMINNVYSKMTNFYSERLPNITYIKTNNMEQAEYEKGVQVSQEKYRADITYKLMYAVGMPIQSLANYISMVFVLLISSSMVRAGTIGTVEMKELLSYFDIVMANATLVLGVWQAIKSTHGGTEKIAQINTAREEDISGDRPAQPGQDIRFEHVSFAYTEGKPILKDVSFHIPAGKITAIVGENGSGKSTVMRLLERFNVPDGGEIKIGTYNLSKVDCVGWRNLIGYVFQGDQMVLGTVGENLAYGADGEVTEEMLIRAAEDAQAYDFIAEKEKGFDTPIGVFQSEFSGGQLQRLAIARAFMKRPEYLFLDEATSGVDWMKEAQVNRSVREMMQGKTVAAISHNMSFVRQADHVVVLRDGIVEAEGTVETVTEKSATFRAFLDAGGKNSRLSEGQK